MTDYEYLNRPDFIRSINVVGLHQKWCERMLAEARVKRRWDNPHPDVYPATITLSEDQRRLEVAWYPLSAWQVPDDEHYGRLYLVAPMGDDVLAWRIEDLRKPHETAGTGQAGQLDARTWLRGDEEYLNVWDVLFNGKLDSPVRNRAGDARYFPAPGTLLGLVVLPWRGGTEARSDIFPLRVPGTPVEPPEPVEPVEPVDEPCITLPVLADLIQQWADQVDEA